MVRDAGGDPLARAVRPRLIDGFMPKIEELVDRSKGKFRADVAHRKITAMGYRGSERSTRRAVAEVKEAWRAGFGELEQACRQFCDRVNARVHRETADHARDHGQAGRAALFDGLIQRAETGPATTERS
jgi:hypothetical protein